MVGGRWSVAHGRWSVVGGWSVGSGFVLRLCSINEDVQHESGTSSVQVRMCSDISIKNIKKKRIDSSFEFEETTYSKIRQLLTRIEP